MTMRQIEQFLVKNRLFYLADITDKNAVNSIEARVYPNKDFRVCFFEWQTDADRAKEIENIIRTNRLHGRTFEK